MFGGSVGKASEPPGSDPWFGEIPWRKAWQPTSVFLPREFHGEWRLVGCSPGGHKESNMIEQLALVVKILKNSQSNDYFLSF